MKFLDKVALVLFSNLIFILAVIMCLIVFGWINITTIQNVFSFVTLNQTASNITLGICIVLILLAIKEIFFDPTTKDELVNKEGVLLANGDGKLLISKETLENLVANVVKKFDSAENVESKVILDKENNVTVYLTLYVKSDAIIKDLSINLQTKIKEEVKRASDLEVKEVNIRVKNITPKQEMIQE